jgi:NAD(P)-dependent dehydrogenase (short-subunit alcohol dehydrogenase family)
MTHFAVYPSLNNKSVLITGGAQGIGAGMVSHFCAQGSRVVFLDVDETSALALIEEIKQRQHVAPTFIHCDLRDVAALKAAVHQAIQQLGGIGVLVNNAGSDERHRTLELTESQWRNILATNLDQQFFTAQAVIPAMIKMGGGSIINLGSNCFILAQNDDYIGYMTAKAAIIGLTRGLAKEFGPQRIRVNSILPGWVMTKRQVEKWLTKQAEEELLKTQALKEKLIPDDIARMALFLAADDSRMCSKQMFVVDAGRT